MSDRFNEKFMKDPYSYIRSHPVDIFPYSSELNPIGRDGMEPKPLDEGVYDFDLNKNKYGATQLTLWKEANAPNEKPIKGYWLPWNPKGVASVSLDTLDKSGVEYVFTSSLAGCRVVMNPQGMHHVSGHLSQSGRSDATDQLTQNLKKHQQKKSGSKGRGRAFSSSSGNNAYGDGGAFLFGYKKSRKWVFVAQTMHWDGLTVNVAKVFANNSFYKL